MPKDNEKKPRYYIRVAIMEEATEPFEVKEHGSQNLHCNDWEEAKRLFDLICNIRLVDPKFWPLLPTFIKFLQQFRNVIEFE